MSDIHNFENFAFYVHNFLCGLWPEHHKSTGEEIPYIPSTHLCRESSVFSLFLLESLSQTGWHLEFGQVTFDEDDGVPLDITDVDGDGIPDDDITSAPHVWLVNESSGYIIDLTADQFGSLLTPTGEGPLISHSSERIYTLADEPQDWSNDPQIVMTAEKWLKSPNIDELIDTLKEALEVPTNILCEPTSVSPLKVRDALARIQEVALINFHPTSPDEALELVSLYQRIEKVYDLTPRKRARDEAISTLDFVANHISTKWEPATDEDHRLKGEILDDVRRILFPEATNNRPPCPGP